MTTPEHGLVDDPAYDFAAVVLESWDTFVTLVEGCDLDADTRLDGWRVRELVVHLGTWGGRSALSHVLESLDGGAGDAHDIDSFNAGVVKKHAGASDDDVRAALRASRDAVAELLSSDTTASRGCDLVVGPLGPMPLLTVVHAGCYELAVHALDVVDAVGGTCPPLLLRHGVAALADSTGCLAAREGIDAAITVNAKEAPWAFTAHADGRWSTVAVEGDAHGPRVSGSAEDLLEASAGRADPVRLVTLRHLKVKHIGGLLALSPVIDQVPGLPGGRTLKLAARSLGGLFNR